LSAKSQSSLSKLNEKLSYRKHTARTVQVVKCCTVVRCVALINSVIFTARRYASAVYDVVVCPSVCPSAVCSSVFLSVCLSQAGTVPKWRNITLRK